MRLMILTQRVSKDDPILGFFHRWIEEFAQHFDSLVVVCLDKGSYDLPANVRVLSLGKEEGQSRAGYLLRFYKYIWQERHNYDAVFVHMNQEYVLLGWKFWRLWGKPIFLWRNHIKGNLLTRIAVILSNRVFCTSPHSYTAQFKKTLIMPAGVDMKKFDVKNPPTRSPNSILSLGRIDPVKNVDVFVKALVILDQEQINFKATVVGDPGSGSEDYYNQLKDLGSKLVYSQKLEFKPAVPNTKTPEMYYSHEIFVNMTNSGSLDKTILSAMASGALVVLCNTSFKNIVPDGFIFAEGDPTDMAKKLEFALSLPAEGRENTTAKLKEYIRSQSLEKTIDLITKEIKK